MIRNQVEVIDCIKWNDGCFCFWCCCCLSFEYSGEQKKHFTLLTKNICLQCFLIICISWCKVIPCLLSERLCNCICVYRKTLFWNNTCVCSEFKFVNIPSHNLLFQPFSITVFLKLNPYLAWSFWLFPQTKTIQYQTLWILSHYYIYWTLQFQRLAW